ncbi:MAG: AAA family ATPase, partial [Candidatus Methanomethylophilaceae archaeon]|nr:AAA family ATPase [Candidatus Methanomethylophilaceae archaeon]
MKQVAVYGKGGIGKSTASANISYILSKSGMKVAQIGCDPKHDSTRLLLKGKTQKTVLDCLNSKEDLRGEIAVTGKNGIVCMETGGPEPGVGCAGRGILTAFDYIKSHSLISEDTDIVLYDVLGDVVCGGFAVPLRKQYANIVFIVTSGEFMSLYAANNVLKGIRNFDSGDKRLAGLILNCRGNDREYEYVKNFADAVGLPIVAVIPRSGRFSAAESEGVTVCEMFPDSEEAASYNSIAEILKNPDPVLYAASPLGDDDLDLVAKGIRVVSGKTGQTVRKLEVTERSALRSCGIRAAAHCCMEILDAEIVAHGPMSCAYMYENGYDRNLLNEGNTWIPSISDRLFSSNLDDRASIFGGGKDLAALLEERISKGAKLIFVLPACVPGIIGDDTENIADTVQSRHPGVRIITIPVDGILCGGAVQGRDMAYERICGLADKTVSPRPDMVNIIGYYDSDDRILTACDDTERILGKLGFGVSCRFLHHNTSSDIAGLRRGSVNLMYSRGV